MQAWLEHIWYSESKWQWVLFPFAVVFSWVARIRRWYLERFKQQQFSTPIVVVGNLTVGGVGKTPLLITLAQTLNSRGLSVGVVSRGYGGKLRQYPHEIRLSDDPFLVGDEPLVIAKNIVGPVIVSPRRVDAVQYLIDNHEPDVILSDDGLQHYSMGRSIEIAVIDGQRRFGNGHYLPAGPLRESSKRLNEVDYVVTNGDALNDEFAMSVQADSIINIKTELSLQSDLLQQPVVAVAGIGNPQRFFDSLERLNIQYSQRIYPDHHRFQVSDTDFGEQQVIMTEKDAVKCKAFATDKHFYLKVSAKVDEAFIDKLVDKLGRNICS